jgi:hypothetical protein
MPPVAQSSRGGLITAVVIFVILFVTATIFAIYYGVDAAKAHEDYATLKNSVIPKVLPAGALTGPELDELDAVRKAEKPQPNITQSMPLLKVATQQRDNFKDLLVPNAPSADAAYNAALDAMRTNAEKLSKAGATPPSTTSLIDSYNQMGTALLAKQQQVNDLQQQLAAAQKDVATRVDQLNAAVAATQDQVNQIQTSANEAIGGAKSAQTNTQQTVSQIEQDRQREREQAAQAINQLNTQLQARTNEADQMNKELGKIRERLAGGRVSVNEPIIKAADATIIRVPGSNIVYISRGAQDQIVPGMTFEIFDRNLGVPRVNTTEPNNEDAMPQGKASIEVVRVGPTSSEARVTRRTPSAPSLQEGDLAVNLVYDPNVKYNFVVFGKFDLGNKGTPSTQDGDIIRQKIQDWGGQIQNQIGINTDFVVIGAEPNVPQLSDEEKRDPIALQRASAAQQEFEQYQAAIKRAQELHVPILNQNRFLYLIGAYGLGTR